MEEVSPEIQESRRTMLALEQREFDAGTRKQSHEYFCYRCGKRTHAKVGSERRMAYFCKRCWDMRCVECGGKGVVKVDGVAYCKEHEIIPTMAILAPSMKPDETPLDTIQRLCDDRIRELQHARSIEDPDEWIKEMLSRTDWSQVNVKAWYGPISSGSGMYRLIVEKETKTFVWVTFKGRTCKLRKTELLGSAIGRWNIYLTRPDMEFKIELPIPTLEVNTDD